MPARRNNSKKDEPPAKVQQKARAELAKNVLATLNPNTPYNTRRAAKLKKTPPSTRRIALETNTSRETVRRIKNASTSSFISTKPQGRPTLLTPPENAALVAFILWLERSGFPADKTQVEETALGFLHSRGIEKDHMSKSWYTDFRNRNPQLQKTYIKAVDKARKAFEVSDVEDIKKFFLTLQNIVTEHRIGPSECWNEDECGIRIGCIRERIQVLVVRTTRSQRPEVIDPANRESCTQIGAANAVGNSIPPWLIFKMFPSSSWSDIDVIPGMRFAQSDTGFSNQHITFK